MTASTWREERARGERFAFGENWARFLSVLDDERVRQAEISLRALLELEDMKGRTFLDAGCGSGLFSLAAARMGAERVHSFDFDPRSVACAEELRTRFGFPASRWSVGSGSVLDQEYLAGLGTWDIVYSWGVLHHTGSMWEAVANVAALVKPGGLLSIALYNDQGYKSRLWLRVKRLFNHSAVARGLVLAVFLPRFVLGGLGKDLLTLRSPLTRYREYRKARGMSLLHDWMDWLGGLPFEVAKPEEAFTFLRERGFTLRGLRTRGGSYGCNEFVFSRERR
jgi:2-polyprenyl-3-methyl-5-hydroxy-6-metoxy-1,4-benzoquinol methylase